MDYAFVTPRAGTISTIWALFSVTVTVTLGAIVTMRAQIYTALPARTIFTPSGDFVDQAPNLGHVIALGDVAPELSLQLQDLPAQKLQLTKN